MVSDTPLFKKLDYKHSDIYLRTTSTVVEGKRLHSCAKEPETIKWIETKITDGCCVWDVGANTGAYSLIMARRYPTSRIFSFEPSYINFYDLCENIRFNGGQNQIIPLNLALGRLEGVQKFYYSSDVVGSALHSLDYDLVSTPVFSQYVLGMSGDAMLDTYKYRPTHVKIDTDGTELEVLEGMQEYISKKYIQSFLVETVADTGKQGLIIEFLGRFGYKIESRHLHNNNLDHHGPYVENIIFARY